MGNKPDATAVDDAQIGKKLFHGTTGLTRTASSHSSVPPTKHIQEQDKERDADLWNGQAVLVRLSTVDDSATYVTDLNKDGKSFTITKDVKDELDLSPGMYVEYEGYAFVLDDADPERFDGPYVATARASSGVSSGVRGALKNKSAVSDFSHGDTVEVIATANGNVRKEQTTVTKRESGADYYILLSPEAREVLSLSPSDSVVYWLRSVAQDEDDTQDENESNDDEPDPEEVVRALRYAADKIEEANL